MKPKIPIFIRLLLWFEAWLGRFMRLYGAIKDEFLWVGVPDAKKTPVGLALYSRQLIYYPGGSIYEQGLFNWEREALSQLPFPKQGRFLVGAAGAGREVVAIGQMGFEVVGFDPCADMVEAGQPCVSEIESCHLIQASYEDVVSFLTPPISSLHKGVFEKPFDGIVLGWGSFSHVLSLEDRVRLLTTLRIHSPHAPILLSFLAAPDVVKGKLDLLREHLRKWFHRLGAPSVATQGDTFWPQCGFVHLFTPEEVRALAGQVGYDVVQSTLIPYPHAVLKPQNP